MVIEMDQNIQKPSIRFKGFTDAWEQCKFKDVFVKLQNNSLSRADLNDENGYAMNVHYGDVLIKFSEILDVQNENIPYITEPTVIEKYKNSFLQNGDIVIADAAEDNTVGKCCEIAGLSQETVLSGLHTIPCRPSKKFASGYLGYYMNSNIYHDQLLPLIQGSKISSISINTLANTSLVYPKSIDEQLLIANKFRALDNLITLHQRKYDKLVNTKKALLDKMFPKAGEATPKLRFRGFTEAWEQCEFREIFSYERPDMFIVSNEDYSDTYDTPVLTANKGFILGYTNETGTYNKPCIIFDDFTLDSKYVDFPFMVKSSAMKMLTNKEGFDLRFSYELLNTSRIENLGHARHYISVVQPTIARTPKLSEQKEISALFQSIDSLITLHQRKYEKLKNIKKALLQKMFV